MYLYRCLQLQRDLTWIHNFFLFFYAYGFVIEMPARTTPASFGMETAALRTK